jgi:hypothetical protein
MQTVHRLLSAFVTAVSLAVGTPLTLRTALAVRAMNCLACLDDGAVSVFQPRMEKS